MKLSVILYKRCIDNCRWHRKCIISILGSLSGYSNLNNYTLIHFMNIFLNKYIPKLSLLCVGASCVWLWLQFHLYGRMILVTLCSIYALWNIGNHFITCNYSIPFTVMPLNSFLNDFVLIWTELILHVIRFVISCKSEWMTPGPITATNRQMVLFGPELAAWVGFLYFSLFFSSSYISCQCISLWFLFPLK